MRPSIGSLQAAHDRYIHPDSQESNLLFFFPSSLSEDRQIRRPLLSPVAVQEASQVSKTHSNATVPSQSASAYHVVESCPGSVVLQV